MNNFMHRFLLNHEGKIKYLLIALGVLSIFSGFFIEFSWLKEIRDSYVTGCRRCQIFDISLTIFTVTGISIIIFATRYLKKILNTEDNFETIIELAVLFILALMLIMSQIRYFDNDEYEHLHNAWLMIEGTLPLLSATSFHTPLLQWLIIPIMKITGESTIIIQTMRVVMFLVSTLSLWLIYKITEELFQSRTTALLAVLLSVCNLVWVMVTPEIRPDSVMIFFTLLSFWVLIQYYKNPKAWYLVVFGLFTLLAVLGKQNAIVFYFALGLVFGYDVLLKKKALAITTIIVGIVVLIMIFQVDALRMFFEANIRKHLIPNDIKFFPNDDLRKVWKFNPALFFLFFFQLMYPLKMGRGYEIFKKYLISISLTSFVFLFLMNRPYLQEFLTMSIFMSILGANVLAEMKLKLNRRVGYFVICVIIWPVLMYIPKTSLKHTFAEDLQTTKTILEISDRDDLVFDSYGKPLFRHHPMEPDYLVYTRFFIEDKSKYENFYAVKKSDVKYLIKDHYYPDYPLEMKNWFEDNFVQTKENPNIFIRRKNELE